MFTLKEIMTEGSMQTGGKEEFFLLMPVSDAHFSKLMQRLVRTAWESGELLQKSPVQYLGLQVIQIYVFRLLCTLYLHFLIFWHSLYLRCSYFHVTLRS